MKKKIIKITALSFLNVILLIIVISLCVLYGRLSSMMSIKKKGNNLYTMNYKENYHLDKALKAGLKDEDSLFNFICDEMFFGYKVKTNISQYGCSAFKSENASGDEIVGRNFDLKGKGTLCVYTNPKGGYKSISTVSMDMVAVGGTNKISPKSFLGRAALLCSPYICVDGMNEKGLSASLLDMISGETHMDTGKPDLIVTLAIRLLMDKASTVDEAIALLKQYDIQTAHGWTQHIFLADASGKSVIVEWHRNEITVVDYNICTNFWMSGPSPDGTYANRCRRFDYIEEYLNNHSTVSLEEAMEALEGSSQSNTVWSVMYNLNNFTADYAVSRDYDEIYHINPKGSHEGLLLRFVIIVLILGIGGITYLTIRIIRKKKIIVESE